MQQNKKAKLTSLALSSTILLTSLTGCSSNKKDNNFIYTADQNGNIKIENNCDYETFSKYVIVEVYNNINNRKELYLCKASYVYVSHYGRTFYVDYKNVFTDTILTSYEFYSDTKTINFTNNMIVLNTEPLSNYLIAYNEIKEFYTSEDLERIYNEIKNDYEYSQIDDNVLTRTKVNK